jgi:rhodanese-related sulfurtransferase
MSGGECPYCSESFADEQSYQRHLRTEHDSQLDAEARERVYEMGLRRPSRRKLVAAAGVLGFGVSVGAYEYLTGSKAVAANEFGYETLRTSKVNVPLVPASDAVEWYDDTDVVFVDARSKTAFENARIAGAIHSPAPEGREGSDPVETLDKDTRIVTYCGCPHHLSTLRGADLISDGYEHTYALDEGFFTWQKREHPLAGANAEERPKAYQIVGRTDAEHTGRYVWAHHESSGQREPSVIGSDGRFTITVRFFDVEATDEILLSTPNGRLTQSLGALARDRVRL